MTISNHKYIYFNKNAGKKPDCKAWGYMKLFNRKNKVWVNKYFKTKREALCYKFIMSLRIKAGHTFVKSKRNAWYI